MPSRKTPARKKAPAPPPPPAAPRSEPAAPPLAAAKRKVFLVDDHPIVRERLAELIAQETDLEVCGEAEDAIGALKGVEALRPDVAVVDITLKDTYGIELIKELKDRHPRLPVLVLSMHDESLYGERSIRAGAKGYLNKQEATKKVVTAIRTVLAGQMFVSEKMTATILQRMSGGQRIEGGDPTDVLTDREAEVFQLLSQGVGVRQIAENLFVSVKTVEAHREHIKQKLGMKSSAELLRFAIEYLLKRS
jgi:DNA-binding NarL/FixJ family response regulator